MVSTGALVLVAVLTGYVQVVALVTGCSVVLLLARIITPAPRITVQPTWQFTRALEGSSPSLHAQVTNTTRRRSTATLIRAEVTDVHGRLMTLEKAAPALDAGATHRIDLPTRDLPRGIYRVTALISDCTDVLGLFHRHHRAVWDLSLTVHPRTVDLRDGRVRGQSDPEEGPLQGPRRAGETFHALRDYQPGDDVRLIHWMATARNRKPVVRDLVRRDVSRRAVLLDTDPGVYPGPSFETAVRIAASLALDSAATGETWFLTTDGRCSSFATGARRDDVLDVLAALDSPGDSLKPPNPRRNGTPERRAGIRLPRPVTTLIVVTGPVVDTDRWRRTAGARELLIVAVAARKASGRRAGTRVVAVPALEDLAPRLRAGQR